MTVARPRRSSDGDGGFTVLELTIAMAISGLVMSILLGVVVSQSNAERRMGLFADNQELVRQTMVLIQRDLRSSTKFYTLPASPQYAASTEYAGHIEFDYLATIDATTPTRIRWVFDSTNNELRREVLDASGATVLSVTHRLRGVTGPAVFEPRTLGGTPFNLTVDASADVARCTLRVGINLIAAPNPGPHPARLASDAVLRNRLPEPSVCR
jgi:prepilin-type N-terminal cleavage/methylation domain-containing protein